MKGHSTLTAVFLFVALGSACDDETPVGPIDHTGEPVASITVDPGTANLAVGETVFLTGTPWCEHDLVMDRPIAWISADDAIATVAPTGLVTAVAPGLVLITASADGRSATASVTVYPAAVQRKAASLAISPAGPFVLQPGQSLQLTAMPYDEEGTAQPTWEVTWSSSHSPIASVDGQGLVTANTVGLAVVRAESYGASGQVTFMVATSLTADRTPPLVRFQAPQSPRTVRPNGSGVGIGLVGTIMDQHVITSAELGLYDSTDGDCATTGDNRLLSVVIDLWRWPTNPLDVANGTSSISVHTEPKINRPGAGSFVGTKTYCLMASASDAVGNATRAIAATVMVNWR